MRRESRLRAPGDLKTLFTKGRKLDSGLFRLTVRRNSLSHSRFVFVASRAVEKRAVRRNRIRRRAREWLRRNFHPLQGQVDLALIFKKEAFASTKQKFYEELSRTIARALRP